MRKISILLATTVPLTILAACGETLPAQAVIGAGAGAATAAVLDGDIATGAAFGAAGNVLYCQSNPGKCKYCAADFSGT